jgi:hypothetical protein
MFAMHDTPDAALSLPGIVSRIADLHNDAAPYDLTVLLTPERDGLSLFAEFHPDLLRRETVDAWLEELSEILGAALENTDKTVSTLCGRETARPAMAMPLAPDRPVSLVALSAAELALIEEGFDDEED